MPAGHIAECFYDGTDFILQNPANKRGIPSGWATINGTGTPAYIDSHNTSGAVIDVGTGKWTATWDRDFVDANYPVAVSPSYGPGYQYSFYQNKLAGSCDINCSQDSVGFTDNSDMSIMAFGQLV